MKCSEPNTDRNAEVTILKNSRVCSEYNPEQDEDGVLSCFISVSENDILSIKCQLTGTTPKYYVDIYVDGVLRQSRCIMMGTKTKSNIIFSDLIRKNRISKEAFKVPLTVVPMLRLLVPGKILTVGTIDVKYSVMRRMNESYPPPLSNRFDQVHHWTELPIAKEYVGPRPSFEIGLGSNTDETELKKITRNTALRSIRENRPGTGPWAVFRFHYRSRDAIKDDGMKCINGQTFSLTIPPVLVSELPPVVNVKKETKVSDTGKLPTLKPKSKPNFQKQNALPKSIKANAGGEPSHISDLETDLDDVLDDDLDDEAFLQIVNRKRNKPEVVTSGKVAQKNDVFHRAPIAVMISPTGPHCSESRGKEDLNYDDQEQISTDVGGSENVATLRKSSAGNVSTSEPLIEMGLSPEEEPEVASASNVSHIVDDASGDILSTTENDDTLKKTQNEATKNSLKALPEQKSGPATTEPNVSKIPILQNLSTGEGPIQIPPEKVLVADEAPNKVTERNDLEVPLRVAQDHRNTSNPVTTPTSELSASLLPESRKRQIDFEISEGSKRLKLTPAAIEFQKQIKEKTEQIAQQRAKTRKAQEQAKLLSEDYEKTLREHLEKLDCELQAEIEAEKAAEVIRREHEEILQQLGIDFE